MIDVSLNGETVSLDTDADFQLDDAALDYEACRTGPMLARYADLAMDLKAQATRAKQNVEKVYASESFQLRTEYAKEGKKATEGLIKDGVFQSQAYIAALDTQAKAEAEAIKVDYFYKSMVKKADLVIALLYKQGREIAKMGTAID